MMNLQTRFNRQEGKAMRKKDILHLCFQNLLRHKSRALLTILGVVVGCCSIVIMVSLGLGMQKAQEQMLAEMGDLTMITVNPAGGRGRKLDGSAVKKIEQLAGVEFAAPKMNLGYTVKVYAGNDKRYSAEYMPVVGMTREAMQKVGFKIAEGEYPADNIQEALVGEFFAYSFADSLRPEGSNVVDLYSMYHEDGTMGEPPESFFQALKEEITIEVIGTDKSVITSLKLHPSGRVKEDFVKGEETYQGILLPMEILEAFRREAAQKSGEALKTGEYSSVSVKATSLEQVGAVEKSIQRLGLRTSSMESIREPMKKEARQKQMMLGGLGAISLFVAAIGIMNTMVMSITERKREIGIMKSIGCFVQDIRTLFLLEAGCIGFFGGLTGIVISEGISLAMNQISGNMISVIPAWLNIFALLFSIFIGVGSGYYPANSAVKISALEAMKP